MIGRPKDRGSRTKEIERYKSYQFARCNKPSRARHYEGACAPVAIRACKAISRLIGRLRRNDASKIPESRDEVRDSLRKLDICRKGQGQRVYWE